MKKETKLTKSGKVDGRGRPKVVKGESRLFSFLINENVLKLFSTYCDDTNTEMSRVIREHIEEVIHIHFFTKKNDNE